MPTVSGSRRHHHAPYYAEHMSGIPVKHDGFTLVELLIVVVILATLAAIVVPQFGATASDATRSTYEATLSKLNKTIERYRSEHLGRYPGQRASSDSSVNTGCSGAGGTSLPGAPASEAAFIAQLTHYTTQWGRTCVCGSASPFSPSLDGKVRLRRAVCEA